MVCPRLRVSEKRDLSYLKGCSSRNKSRYNLTSVAAMKSWLPTAYTQLAYPTNRKSVLRVEL